MSAPTASRYDRVQSLGEKLGFEFKTSAICWGLLAVITMGLTFKAHDRAEMAITQTTRSCTLVSYQVTSEQGITAKATCPWGSVVHGFTGTEAFWFLVDKPTTLACYHQAMPFNTFAGCRLPLEK